MKLVSNWRAVLAWSWSQRLIVLAAVLSGCEIAIPLMDGYLDIPQKVFAALAAFTAMLAFLVRFIAQSNIPPK